MLGCVKEVSEFEVVVGLPSGLVGYLPIYNICDSYTKILNNRLDSEDLSEVTQLHKERNCEHICCICNSIMHFVHVCLLLIGSCPSLATTYSWNAGQMCRVVFRLP